MTVVVLPFNLVAGQNENVNQLNSNLAALVTGVNGIDTAQINAAQVTDAKLASPNNGIYRVLQKADFTILGATATGIYWLGGGNLVVSGGSITGAGILAGLIPITAAELAAPGKSAVLRTRVVYGVNNVAMGGLCIPKPGLHPVSGLSGAAANTIGVTLGAAVGSSQAVISNAVLANVAQASTPDYALPADGVYALGIQISGNAVGGNCCCSGSVILEYRSV